MIKKLLFGTVIMSSMVGAFCIGALSGSVETCRVHDDDKETFEKWRTAWKKCKLY